MGEEWAYDSVASLEYHARLSHSRSVSLNEVKEWIDREPDFLSSRDPGTGWLPLHAACWNDRSLPDVILLLVYLFPKAAAVQDSHQRYPIHIYAANCTVSVQVLEQLTVAHPAALQARDVDGCLPLHWAAEVRSYPAVHFMILHYPAAAGERDNKGNLPLHYVFDCYGPRLHVKMKVAEMLARAYPPSLLMRNNDGFLPIQVAISSFQIELEFIRFLIELCPESLRVRDCDGRLLLHSACQWECHLDVIELLIQKFPASIWATDLDGFLPLHLVSGDRLDEEADTEIIEFLVGKYAGALQHANTDGWLPLHAYVARKELINPDAVELLIEKYPLAVTVVDGNLNLPIHLAAANHFALTEHVQLLIEKHPSGLRVFNGTGQLPLHMACTDPTVSPQKLRLLIDYYPEALQRPDSKGRLPLHVACIHSLTPRTIQLLVDRYAGGAQATDHWGNWPLFYASQYCSLEVVLLFMEHVLDFIGPKGM